MKRVLNILFSKRMFFFLLIPILILRDIDPNREMIITDIYIFLFGCYLAEFIFRRVLK